MHDRADCGVAVKSPPNSIRVYIARSAYRTPQQRGYDYFIVYAKARTAIPRSHSLPLLICHTVQFPCATYTTAPPSSIRDTTRTRSLSVESSQRVSTHTWTHTYISYIYSLYYEMVSAKSFFRTLIQLMDKEGTIHI